MSFHKRRYNWYLIINRIKSDNFKDFDNWIFKPEAHFLEDQESSDFFKSYCNLSDYSRELLFGAIKIESEDFYKDLIKCINVVLDPNNNEQHKETIGIYKDLFIVKWGEISEKYKSIIEN